VAVTIGYYLTYNRILIFSRKKIARLLKGNKMNAPLFKSFLVLLFVLFFQTTTLKGEEISPQKLIDILSKKANKVKT
jgi:hypothetical protein